MHEPVVQYAMFESSQHRADAAPRRGCGSSFPSPIMTNPRHGTTGKLSYVAIIVLGGLAGSRLLINLI